MELDNFDSAAERLKGNQLGRKTNFRTKCRIKITRSQWITMAVEEESQQSQGNFSEKNISLNTKRCKYIKKNVELVVLS